MSKSEYKNYKDYYVYLHFIEGEDKPFYVGSGRKERKDVRSGRNARWNSKVENKKWYSLIVEEGLSKRESINRENFYIEKYRSFIVNRNAKVSYLRDLDIEWLSKRYKYDENSPSCLVFNEDTCHNKNGMPAGRINNSGYYEVTNKRNNMEGGCTIAVHRVIMALHGINITDMYIDHKNGVKTDNKLSNLRAVTPSENLMNKKSSSKTNFLGVAEAKTGFSVSKKGRRIIRVSWKKFGKEIALALSVWYRLYIEDDPIVIERLKGERKDFDFSIISHLTDSEKLDLILDSKTSANSSGFVGVGERKNSNRFVSQILFKNGHLETKSFSYGKNSNNTRENAWNEACEYHNNRMSELFDEYVKQNIPEVKPI